MEIDIGIKSNCSDHMVTMAYLKGHKGRINVKKCFDIYRNEKNILEMEIDSYKTHDFDTLINIANALISFAKEIRIKHYYNEMNGPNHIYIDFTVFSRELGFNDMDKIEVHKMRVNYAKELLEKDKETSKYRSTPVFFKNKRIQKQYDKIHSKQKTREQEDKEREIELKKWMKKKGIKFKTVIFTDALSYEKRRREVDISPCIDLKNVPYRFKDTGAFDLFIRKEQKKYPQFLIKRTKQECTVADCRLQPKKQVIKESRKMLYDQWEGEYFCEKCAVVFLKELFHPLESSSELTLRKYFVDNYHQVKQGLLEKNKSLTETKKKIRADKYHVNKMTKKEKESSLKDYSERIEKTKETIELLNKFYKIYKKNDKRKNH